MPRIRQRDLLPTAVKGRALAQETLVNTNPEILGPFSLTNGSSLGLRSIITSLVNEDYRLGAVPFCVTFFQTSLSASNIIGDGITSGYNLVGPMAMAVFTPYAIPGTAGGSDGNNLVFVTRITNNTGSTQTIYAITSTRVYIPGGGIAG